MDDALVPRRWWFWPRRERAQPPDRATAGFGGDQRDEPVLIAVVNSAMEADMARAALEAEQIPVLIKGDTTAEMYALHIGALASREIWTMPVFAEQARDVLIGMGLLDPEP